MVFLGWGYFAKIQTPKKKPKRFAFKLGQNQEIFVWGQGPSTKSQNQIIELLRFIGHRSSTLGKKSWDKCVVLFHHIFWNTLGTWGTCADAHWEPLITYGNMLGTPNSQNLNLTSIAPPPPNPSRKKEGPSWVRIEPSNWLNENIKKITITK